MAAGDQVNYRTCCCVGYLTNPGGRCCMDMPAQGSHVWTSDKIIIGEINPVMVAQGWQCPLCKTVHAPHVNKCECDNNAR